MSLNGNESCTATTDATGTASCSVTPSEAAATYPLTGTFAGDTSQPLQLMASNGSSNFVVTLEETALTYTGPTIAHNGQPLALSGVLTTDDPGLGTPIAGRTVTFVLGSGASAQTCAAVTDATGTAACTIASVSQAPGPIPVTDTFAGDAYYQTASASSTVNLPEGTQLTVNPTTGHLRRVDAGVGDADEHLHEPARARRARHADGQRHAVVHRDHQRQRRGHVLHHAQRAGGDLLAVRVVPRGHLDSGRSCCPADSTTTFTVTPAPTTVTYTGPTTVTNGQPTTLSGVLTTSEPTPGSRSCGRDGDVHHRLGRLGAELHRHHGRQRRRQLHRAIGQPDHRHGHGHDHVQRGQHLLPAVLDQHARPRSTRRPG